MCVQNFLFAGKGAAVVVSYWEDDWTMSAFKTFYSKGMARRWRGNDIQHFSQHKRVILKAFMVRTHGRGRLVLYEWCTCPQTHEASSPSSSGHPSAL
jgi:hypothetical protein